MNPELDQLVPLLSPPEDRVYARRHLWISRSGHHVEVGLDAMLAFLLPSIHAVIFPTRRTRLRLGSPCCWLHAEGLELAIPSPLEGAAVEPNPGLFDRPNLVRETSYEAGYLFRVVDPDPVALRWAPFEDYASAIKLWFADRGLILKALEERTRDLGFYAADGGMKTTKINQILGGEQLGSLLKVLLCETKTQHGPTAIRVNE